MFHVQTKLHARFKSGILSSATSTGASVRRVWLGSSATRPWASVPGSMICPPPPAPFPLWRVSLSPLPHAPRPCLLCSFSRDSAFGAVKAMRYVPARSSRLPLGGGAFGARSASEPALPTPRGKYKTSLLPSSMLQIDGACCCTEFSPYLAATAVWTWRIRDGRKCFCLCQVIFC